ncbi:3-oxoacyl-ACP synthase [Actinosynnema sp. ALI-1.44]|uniref:3-oxoacyl-ACP synthase III family protein n=1 Tax=Actinosynnema sp. ALI-1.44 TaxID=1933779 RepID=UPI00097BB125|nr:3-oxoacyl-[acyl-carrier-protein] synthase III C-terminal domain-containing protein [Actinosynnema sp. ALI-1.44]ONI76338.1 3-oxoacyl-ACP synthase [Actinosynnema sp. ALI-1.44]
MRSVSLVDVAGYLPEKRVPAQYYADLAASDKLAGSVMFSAPAFRHHVAPDESAVDMIERTVESLAQRHGMKTLREVDVLITHVQLPDSPLFGCGGDVARRLGMRPEWVYDLHNGGCASFLHMIKLARHFLLTTDARSALVCAVANTAGQMFDQSVVRTMAQAAIPGDGAGAGLLTTSSHSPILDVEARHIPGYAGDMTLELDNGRKYWEPGEEQMHIGFTEHKVAEVIARGTKLVPDAVGAVCERIGVQTKDIDTFVTNQPNRVFLRRWRDALGLAKESYPDTFDECGNIFAAGVPITLDRELRAGRVADDSLLMLAGFAHAGDFAGAAAIRWRN